MKNCNNNSIDYLNNHRDNNDPMIQITNEEDIPNNNQQHHQKLHPANPTTSFGQPAAVKTTTGKQPIQCIISEPTTTNTSNNNHNNNGSKLLLPRTHRKYSLDKTVYSSNPCVGCLERIPLSIKLLLVVIIPIVSLTALGGYFIKTSIQQLQTAKNIDTLSTFIISLGDITQQLQVELGLSLLMTNGFNTTDDDDITIRNKLERARNATDQAIAQYKKKSFTAEDLIFNKGLTNLKNVRVEFNNATMSLSRFFTTRYRERIKTFSKRMSAALCHRTVTRNLTSIIYNDRYWWDNNEQEWNNTFYYFLFFNQCVLKLLGVVSDQIPDSTYNSYQDSYLLLKYEMYYLYSQIWVGGCKYILGNFTRPQLCIYDVFANKVSSTIQFLSKYSICCMGSFIKYIKRRVAQELFRITSTQEIFDIWYNTIGEIKNQTKYSFSLRDPFDGFVSGFILLSEASPQIEKNITNKIQEYSNGIRQHAIIEATGIILGTLITIGLSLCFAIVFSRNILTPWKRVLKLQEDTVHKFVPREFMTIIHKDRILDLNYGDYFEKELDIMFVDIRNYTGISENMQARELFNFLNSYLSLVGPLITYHGGYIDKYMGDGFIALFLSPGNSIKAAVEIQQSVRKFNETGQYKPFAVGCGIVRGKCAVGLVGESKRMDPTIIGDVVNLSARLESLTKYYGAGILVSESVIKSHFHLNSINFRWIGNVAVVGKKEYVKIYEIIPFEDSSKIKTIKLFEEANECLFNQHKFDAELAENLLHQVLTIDPSDKLALMRLELAKQLESNEEHWNFYETPTTK